MVMQAMRDGASNTIVKYGLFGMLMLAAAGLALTGGNGLFTGGGFSIGGNDVVKVGDESLSMQSFDRSLRRALAHIGIQPREAYKLGYVNQVLSQEIQSRLMAQAARDNDILIARKRVAGQINKMIAPMVKDGQKPDDVLKMLLMNQGMTEGEMVNSISREMAGSIMAGVIQGGFAAVSNDMVKDFYDSQYEKRDIQYVAFLDKDAKDIPKASDEDLKKLYVATKESYALPETRALQVVKVKDDNLKKTLQISDAEVKQYYDDNKETYSAPASHMLEESLFDKEDQAKKVHDLVKGGKPMQDAVKEVTGQIAAYLGPQDVEDAKILDDLKAPVMAAKAGDLLGPIKTPLGYQVVLVKKISGADTKPFDAVKDDIKKDLMATKLGDAQYALANQVDDQLASGAKLEDVAKAVDIEIVDLPPVNQFGQGADGKDALKAFDKTGPAILATGFKLQQDETSPVSQMADGSFMAVHLKTLKKKTYKPFADIKDDLAKKWVQDQTQMENKMRVAGYLEEMKNGKKSLSDIAQAHGVTVQTVNGLTRKDAPPKPLAKEASIGIFESAIGSPLLIDVDGGTGIAVPTAYQLPPKPDPKDKAYEQFHDAMAKDVQNEAIALYLDAKNRKYKAVINQGLLDKAYGSAAAGQSQPGAPSDADDQ